MNCFCGEKMGLEAKVITVLEERRNGLCISLVSRFPVQREKLKLEVKVKTRAGQRNRTDPNPT